MIIREVIPDEREQYNEVVNHILQSYEWGIFRETTGVKVIRIGTYEGNILTSGFQLTLHPIPNTSYTIGYFPRGPALTQNLLDNLIKIGKEHQCIFIKIEPMTESQEIKILEQPGIKILPASPILPTHTFFVDLTSPEEEILARMKDKTRYNIRYASKNGVKIWEKEDSLSLHDFINLASETAKRQGFFTHPPSYYENLWDILHPNKMAYLLMAYLNETLLAGLIIFRFKEMIYYLYGASATVHRELMPNHFLQWETIRLGKRLGCKTYDMWGAYKNTPTENDPWYGIYRFKRVFGGELVDYPKTVDLVFLPRLYKLYNFLDPLRFKLLALKRSLLK